MGLAKMMPKNSVGKTALDSRAKTPTPVSLKKFGKKGKLPTSREILSSK